MRHLKETFNAGEFTPRLHSRYKLSKYESGCKTLTNFLPVPHGPVTRRPGTEYIASIKTATKFVRLLPFVFSEDDAYVLEAGDSYIRFFKNGGQIQTVPASSVLLLHFDGPNFSTTITDSGDTGHSPAVNGDAKLKTQFEKFGTASLFCDGTGDFVSIADHADWNFGTSTFTIDFWVRFVDLSTNQGFFQQYVDGDNYYALYWTTSNTIIFQVREGGSNTALIGAFSWTPVQSNWHHVALIRGWGGNSDMWSICIDGASIGTESDSVTMPDFAGDFDIGNILNSTYFHGYIDEFRVINTAAWTANFTPPSSQYPFGDDSGTTYEIATTYTETSLPALYHTQSADVMHIVHKDFVVRTLSRTADASWAISNVTFTNAPAAWSAGDYPRTVTFYEDRLCFGGSPDQPDTVWTTDTGDYAVFTGDAADDSAITLTLAARKINDILWLNSGRRLIAGTGGEEWWCSGPSDTEPITPSNQIAKRDSSWGSERVMPVDIGETVFFIQRGGRSVREMIYDYSSDKYKSTDVSILAEHLTREYKITDMAFQQKPYQVLWCVRSDGSLLALTYLKDHDVIGWSKHTSGSGEFESVCTIPGTEEDEVWFVVKRTVDGSVVRYIERLKPFNYGTDLEDAFFVDCGLSYEGAAVTSVSGLDHLEGEAVDVLADGVVVTGKTVSGGSISLSTAASKIHIGLSNTPEFESLDFVSQDEKGVLQGVTNRVTNVWIRLVKSMGGVYGPDSSRTDPIPYDDETAPYTGWTKDLAFDEGFDQTSTVYIKCDEPLPMEIAAILIDSEE